MDLFQELFSNVYANLVDTDSNVSGDLVGRIESMGREFAISVFKSVNDFVNAIFETLLTLYDPEILGFFEDIEKNLDRVILARTVFGQTYYVLLVLSRVMSKEKDKDLRFKA